MGGTNRQQHDQLEDSTGGNSGEINQVTQQEPSYSEEEYFDKEFEQEVTDRTLQNEESMPKDIMNEFDQSLEVRECQR